MKEKKHKKKNSNKNNEITKKRDNKHKGTKKYAAADTNRTMHKRFIIDGIEKQALKQQMEALKIKKIRKCKTKRNKYMITLKTSKRVKEVQGKVKTAANSAISTTAAIKGQNFLEEEYSNHSDSYIELEQFQELQKKMQNLQHQREQDLLEQKKLLFEQQQEHRRLLLEQQEQTLKSRLSYEDKILALTHEFQQFQQQNKLLQQELQQNNEKQKEAQLQLSQLQSKIDQYESHQFQNILQGLNGFKNYIESNEVQAKITKFSQKLKNQKYNEKQMVKDEQVAEDQALAQIAYKMLTIIATATNGSNENKTTPFKFN